MSELRRQKANTFRELHHSGKVLILPNVWDVAGAGIVEDAGFPAIATTSAGIAFSLGYPDGQKISRDEMLARVGRIVRAAKVPVTADVEAGYGERPEDAAETARAVIEAGAVGLNLEDSTDDPQHPLISMNLQLEKIHAVREAAMKSSVLLVLNARTDVYLAEVGAPELRYFEAIKRVMAYRDAGADCVFVPGLRDRETIKQLVQDAKCPINILAGPGSLPIPELQNLGVARVSLGSGPMRATLGLLRRIAEEVNTSGTYSSMEGAPAHSEVNKMLG